MSKTRLLTHFATLNRFGVSYERCLETGLAQEKSRDFLNQRERRFSIGLSSGTSGRRGVFLTTEHERIRWAATILAHADFLSLRKKQNVAFFLRSNSPLYEQAGGARLRFRFFDLAQSFEKLLPELQLYDPSVLIGPPALLTAVRKADKEKFVQPEVVVSVADKLEKDVKLELEAHFGKKLFEIYQATEGFLGISCKHGTLHLNEDLHFFERRYTDENKTAFEPIISDFFRFSQAIVRFHLDDVLVPQSSCSCGSRRQAIREVLGRSDDVLVFTDRSGSRLNLPPDFLRHAIQNHLDRDLDFKVTQEGDARLKIQLENEPTAEALAKASSELRDFFLTQDIVTPALDWSFELKRGLGEKRKRVERR